MRSKKFRIGTPNSLLFTPNCSSSDKMGAAVDVEQLAGHKVAFRR